MLGRCRNNGCGSGPSASAAADRPRQSCADKLTTTSAAQRSANAEARRPPRSTRRRRTLAAVRSLYSRSARTPSGPNDQPGPLPVEPRELHEGPGTLHEEEGSCAMPRRHRIIIRFRTRANAAAECCLISIPKLLGLEFELTHASVLVLRRNRCCPHHRFYPRQATKRKARGNETPLAK